MLFFKHRKTIEELFYLWAFNQHVKVCPNSLVAYMQIKGWLKEDKIIEDLKKGVKE